MFHVPLYGAREHGTFDVATHAYRYIVDGMVAAEHAR